MPPLLLINTVGRPAFDRKHLPVPPFELRIALVCAQILNYSPVVDPGETASALYYRVFDDYEKEHSSFDSEYTAAVRERVSRVKSLSSALKSRSRGTDSAFTTNMEVADVLREQQRAAEHHGKVAAMKAKLLAKKMGREANVASEDASDTSEEVEMDPGGLEDFLEGV